MNVSATPTLGDLIDSLYNLRAERLEVEKTVKELKTSELAIRVQILKQLESIGLDGAKGQAATAAIIYEDQPAVDDWTAVYQYIEQTGEFDLMQRRVSATAIRDRWSEGKEIPGIRKVQTTDLSLTKRNK